MLVRALGKHNVLLTIVLVTMLIEVSATLWQPSLMKNVLSIMANLSLSTSKKNDIVSGYGIKLIAIAVTGLIGSVLNTIVSANLAQVVSANLREDTFRKIQTLSYADIERFNPANLVVRLTNDINQIQMLLMMTFQVLIRVPLLFIGSFILSIITMPQLWWVIVAMVVLIVIVTAISMRSMGPHFEAFQKLMDKIYTIAKENLQGSKVVKSFVQEKNQKTKFNKESDKLLWHNLTVGYIFAILIPVFTIISQLAIFIAILFISFGITQSASFAQDQLGGIMSFIQYMMQIMFAIIMGGMMSMFASRGLVSIGRIREVWSTKSSMVFLDTPMETLSGDVEFDHVSFSYPNDELPTLKDISFKVQSGQQIGIVGATGTGKSTLAHLIPRLFDPTEGTVKVGGKDLKTVSRKTLRNTVSIVLQKTILFSGTIMGNLKKDNDIITNEDMNWAAQIAQAEQFINNLPERYDTKVFERANNFSGGQKQRLSITRGVIKQPKILILDDSTSALDARSERMVQEAFDRELKNTTTIIIAQKISSVVLADTILVMDQGKLVAKGTHKELIEISNVYRNIYETQKAQGDGANE